MQYLCLGADRAGRNKVLYVPPHLRPPQLALDEGHGSVGAGVAIELGGMTPLDDLRSGVSWDV